MALLSLANVQISTTAKHIARTDLNDTSVSPNAEGDRQHPHEYGEETTELHTCSGCVTDIEGSLRKDQLRNGSEEAIIGGDHLEKLGVKLLLSWIKMLLTVLIEAVAGMWPDTPTPGNETPMPRNAISKQVILACPGRHCGNCEPQCPPRFA